MNKEIRTHKEKCFHQMTCPKIIMMNTLTPSYSFSKSDLFLNNCRFFFGCLFDSVYSFLTKDVLCIILGLLSHIWSVQWTEKLKSLGCSCVHKRPLPVQIFLNKRKRVINAINEREKNNAINYVS